MNYLPDLHIDFSKDENATRQMLDYAVNQYQLRRDYHLRIDKFYDDYNGIVNTAEIQSTIKATGTKSKTKYIKYRLGRSKIKQLHGEFLEINIEPTVTTVNREAQNKKMEKYKSMLGMSLAKSQINKAREMGYKVYEGMNIPDYQDEDYWSMNNFKLANEITMQNILEDKIINERIKMRFYNNFVDQTIASECFGKIERDANGKDTYRVISPKDALYEESLHDPFIKNTPYMGERREMFYHEIISNPEFNLTDTEKLKLKESYNNNTLWSDGYDSDYHQQTRKLGDYKAMSVYSLEWIGLETVYLITSKSENSDVPFKKIISESRYTKSHKKIAADVKAGKYKLEKFYRQILWSANRIGADIYTKPVKEEYLIQRLNDNGKFTVDFNYCGLLFGTVNGVRVSMQEVIHDLEKIYDDIRFQINRELKKIRGDAFSYDEAYLPKGKNVTDILHNLTEDGLLRYNSSAEGNKSGIDSESNKVGVGAINMGQSQVMMILLNQALDIERVMDRVTGMNENRQGLTKATTTATTNINNIEASRSMTYDLFFFMNAYMEDVLLKLCEKTKLNQTYYGMDTRKFIYDYKDKAYFTATKDLMYDSYGVRLTDGKKERDILTRIEGLFPQEINAGMLRTKDVAEFYQSSSFAEAIKVLDKAHKELTKIREEEARVNQETQNKQIETNIELQREDREDRQEHEKDMEIMRGENQKEVTMLKESMSAKAKLNEAAMKNNQQEENVF